MSHAPLEEEVRRLRQRVAELEGVEAQRTRAVNALRQSEERLQSILDETTAVVYLKDRQGRYLLINRQFEELFHVSKAEVLGKTDLDLFPAETAREFRKNDLHVLETQAPVQFDEIAPHDDGLHNYISVKFPLRDASGEPYAVCGISTDITEHKLTLEKLRDEDRILKKLLDLQERERRLVAYDIHDGFVQYVVGAKMILEGAAGKLQDEENPEAEALLQVEQLLAKAIEEGRRVIGDLRPMIIDEKGIVEAIYYLIAEAGIKQKPAISFSHHVQFDRLDPLMEGAMFRIVQEAITNAQRHSQAEHVTIGLTQIDDQVRLEIRDDGIGFDPADVPEDRFGLDGIRKRGQLFGGSTSIESSPGHGTTIKVDLPLSQP
ncbi:MAG: PAS domain-containing protein [Planctomycetes bacterium]|nr:PAS domain-containing protein [Planctomycetota bacterium]